MKTENSIKLINYTIRSLANDEFTVYELADRIKERYPKFVPSIKTLMKHLGWSKVNAIKIGKNGRYRRIN